MILYIHFGYLSKFRALYNDSVYLQEVLENLTGVKWMVKEDADIDRINRMLKAREIIFDIE